VYFANKILETATWRWAYYGAIIYSVIALVGTFIVYFPPSRPQHDHEKTRWQEIRELDFIGETSNAEFVLPELIVQRQALFSIPLV